MDTLFLTLTVYGLTIVFAFIIAASVHGLGIFIKKLRLDREADTIDISVPTADSEREQQQIAVAIALATAARAGRIPSKN